ncbi:MAG: LLM class flavin-dependent oxidoreductase [Chloroflexi bacterium]|nr:LLM class flavin-dependent oxidoreductase [Chloroflexota bacterium]MBI3732517.1 LLM class flavin-dependent oxidoreductase [Chloroflexota bacterium]
MKYGFVFPGGEARAAVELAEQAEAAGWDGFFVPDALWWHDPWITLAAVAMRTERLRIGTMITPVSRRRPWTLASQTATLDRLSNGRVILSVGLGATDSGFAEFGEATDRKARAELLDEGLDIITGLWRGQSFNYSGNHYTLREVKSFPPPPPPVQSPRIPIWVVGAWPRPKSMQRALRYDGLLPNKLNADGKHGKLTPADVRAMKAYIENNRTEPTPFDIVVEGRTPGDHPKKAIAEASRWAKAGATWWLEADWSGADLDRLRARLRHGPPQLDGEPFARE